MRLLFLLVVLSFSNKVFCQSHTIKINPIILSFKAWNIGYEYTDLEKNWGLQLNAIAFGDGFFIDTRMTGIQITIDYKRCFPNKKTYFAPFLRYQNMEFEDFSGTISHKHPGIGLIVGKVFHPFNIRWWSVDMYAGINHISRRYEIVEGEEPIDIDVPVTIYGTGPRFGITTGINF